MPSNDTKTEDRGRLRAAALRLIELSEERLSLGDELDPRDLKRLASVLLDARRLLDGGPGMAGQTVMVEFINTDGAEG